MQDNAAIQSMHEQVVDMTRHYTEELQRIDSEISGLEQQKAIIKAIALTQLTQSPELKEAAGGNHELLIKAIYAH
jgi:hypothetical protein